MADESSGTTPIPMRQATAKAILTRGSISVLRMMTRSVLFLMPDDANKTLEKSRSSELCNNHCTVVRFEGHRAEERATEFVKKCEKRKIKLCNPQTCRTWENYYPLKNAKVEHLGQGYEALEGGKTYQSIVYDRFAGARRVSPTGEKRKK